MTWFLAVVLIFMIKKELQSDADEYRNREHRGRALLMHKPHRFVLKIESSQIDDTGTYKCLVDGKVTNITHVFVHGWNDLQPV